MQLEQDGRWFSHEIKEAPRNAIRGRNLAWELPIAAATGALIAAGDSPASREIQSPSLQRQAGRWSNIGLGLALGGAGAAYALGCAKHRDSLRAAGQLALEAAGAATIMGEFLKFATNRQRPNVGNSSGEYWEGGRSFPSGHASASFAIASALAHSSWQARHRWLKWGIYGLAVGVSLSRYPAKQHFFSDILVGGTLGYVTGASLASPHEAVR